MRTGESSAAFVWEDFPEPTTPPEMNEDYRKAKEILAKSAELELEERKKAELRKSIAMAKNTQHILDEANRRQKSAANYANMNFNVALERIPQSEDLLPHIARKELRPKEELSADRIIQNLEDNQRRLEQELRRERLPEEKIQRKYYPFDFGQPDDGVDDDTLFFKGKKPQRPTGIPRRTEIADQPEETRRRTSRTTGTGDDSNNLPSPTRPTFPPFRPQYQSTPQASGSGNRGGGDPPENPDDEQRDRDRPHPIRRGGPPGDDDDNDPEDPDDNDHKMEIETVNQDVERQPTILHNTSITHEKEAWSLTISKYRHQAALIQRRCKLQFGFTR